MFDEYGIKINSIVQGKCLYTIPNHGQMNRCFNEEAIYEYGHRNVKGCDTGLRMQMNAEKADRYAKFNGLNIIK